MATAISGQASLLVLGGLAQARELDLSSPRASTAASVTSVTTITISTAAQSGLEAAAAGPSLLGAESIARFASHFPTREGFPIDALAEAVLDPAAVSSSAGKSAAEVAAGARATLDAKYAAMAATGDPFTLNSARSGNNVYGLMGEFDRRSLSAIANNADRLFSKDEQDLAQSMLSQQLQLAMQWAHPLPSVMEDSFSAELATQFAFAMEWLDKASPDEKASLTWAIDRSYAERVFEGAVEMVAWQAGIPAPIASLIAPLADAMGLNYRSDNPLVQLIREVGDHWRLNPDEEVSGWETSIRNAEDLKAQPWMAPGRDRVDAALAEARKKYGV